MFRRPFLNLTNSRLRTPLLEMGPDADVKRVPMPKRVTLMARYPETNGNGLLIREGDQVKTGQRLALTENGGGYLFSSVTGTLEGVSQYTGYLQQPYLTVSIESEESDLWDDEFDQIKRSSKPQEFLSFLKGFPGTPALEPSSGSGPSLDTIVIYGLDCDLMVQTNRFVLRTETDLFEAGVEHLKGIFPESRMILVCPLESAEHAQRAPVEVRTVEAVYPNTLPKMLTRDLLGRVIPAGKEPRDVGIGFIQAETVAALGWAFLEGRIPVEKSLTFIGKDYRPLNLKVRIGTPLRELLRHLQLETAQGDRVILGGPMRGIAVHSLDMPVAADTQAILVQDKSQIVPTSNTHCVNCGECVRACPAKIQVNMLIRVLENGQYQEAVKSYDLLSCIECGLCSYVCIARIPIFHYIMLGKHEFAKIEAAEEINE